MSMSWRCSARPDISTEELWDNLLNHVYLPICVYETVLRYQTLVTIFFWMMGVEVDASPTSTSSFNVINFPTSKSISTSNIQKKVDVKFNFTSEIHFFLDVKFFKYRFTRTKLFHYHERTSRSFIKTKALVS